MTFLTVEAGKFESLKIDEYFSLEIETLDDIIFKTKVILLPEKLCELEALHNACFPIVYPKSFYENILTDDYSCLFAVCKSTGRIVGFSVGRCQNRRLSCLGRREGYICTFGVASEFRNKGLGSCLLRNTISLFKNYHQVNYLTLHVLVTNKSAIRYFLYI